MSPISGGIMKYLLAISLMLFVYSCKSEKEDDDLVSGSNSALVGSWDSNCLDRSAEMSEPYSTKIKLVITDLVYERFVTDYTSTNCDESTKDVRIRYIGTYTFDGSTLDLSVQDLGYIRYTAFDVSQANSSSNCGYSDWVIGVEKSTIDKDEDCVQTETQGTVYNIPTTLSGPSMYEDSFTFTKQ